jgi:4-amino-4-deoxy-L-arabinose transferase-like glycosyltransferase
LVYKSAATIFSHKIASLSAFLFAIDINTFLPICLNALYLGMATLVRPISFLFSFVAIFYILVLSNLNPKKRLINSVAFSVIFIVSISPWLLRNYSKYGEAKLSSISGYNLLLYNAASTESFRTSKPIEEIRKGFYQLPFRKVAIQQIFTHLKIPKYSLIYPSSILRTISFCTVKDI